jgi:hypothetical protein
MAVTVQSLVRRYPEFQKTDQLHVQACISDAELMVDRGYYGTKADMAVHALAAHYLAISPVGEMARLDKKSEETVYSRQYTSIKRSVGAGFRVI